MKNTKQSDEHTLGQALSALWQRLGRGYRIASSAAALSAVAMTAIVASFGFADAVHAAGSEDVVPGDNPICTMSTSGSFSFNTLLADTLTVNLTGNCTRYPVLWEWTGKPLAYGLRNMAGDNVWFTPLLNSGVMVWTYDYRKVTTVNTIPLVFNKTGTFTFAVRAKDADYIPPNNQPAGFWGPWGVAGALTIDTSGGYKDITLSCFPQTQTRSGGVGGALVCSGGQVSSITETRTFCADSVTPGWGPWVPAASCACPTGTTWNGAACVPVPTCNVTATPALLAPGQTANWNVACDTPPTSVTWTTSTPPVGIPRCTTGTSCPQTYPQPGTFCYAVSGANVMGTGATSASSCVTVACTAGQVWNAAANRCGTPPTISAPNFAVGLPQPASLPITTTGTPAITCTAANLPAGWTMASNCTLTTATPGVIEQRVPVGCTVTATNTWGFNTKPCIETLSVPLPVCTLTATPMNSTPGQAVSWTASCNTSPATVTWRVTAMPPPTVCTTGTSCVQTYVDPRTVCYAVTGSNVIGTGAESASTCVVVACTVGQTWSATGNACGIAPSITAPTFVVGLPRPATLPVLVTGTPSITCSAANLPAGWSMGANCTLKPAVVGAIEPRMPASCTVTATNNWGTDTKPCIETLGVPLPVCAVTATPSTLTPGQTVNWSTSCNTPTSLITWRVTSSPPSTLCTTGATCVQTYVDPRTVCYAVTGSNVLGAGAESAATCATVACTAPQTWSATGNACGLAPTISAPTFEVGLPRPATIPVTVTGTPTLTCTAFNLPAGWSMSAACLLTPNNPGFTETLMPVGCTVTVTNPWGSDTRSCLENITPQTACAVNWLASPSVLRPMRQNYTVQVQSSLINPDLGPVIGPPGFGPLSRLSGNGGSALLGIDATKADVIESVVCNGSDPIVPVQPSTSTGLSFNTVNFFDLLALPAYNGQVVLASATGQYNLSDTESYTETYVSALLSAPAQIGRTAPSASSCTVTVRNSTTGNRATCTTPDPLEVVKLGERDTCSLTPESNTNGMSVWKLDTGNTVQANIPGAGNFSGTVETIKQSETLYTLLSLRASGSITSPKTLACVKRHRTAANPNAARSAPFSVDISNALFQSPPVYVTAQEDLVFANFQAGWVNPRSTFTQVINPSEDDFDLDCRYVGTVNNTLTGQPANVSCSAFYSYRTGAACSFVPGVATQSSDYTYTGFSGGGAGTTYQGNSATINGVFNYIGDTMTASWSAAGGYDSSVSGYNFSYGGTTLSRYGVFGVTKPWNVPITPSRTLTPTPQAFMASAGGWGYPTGSIRYDLDVRRDVYGRDSVGSCFVQAGFNASSGPGGATCTTCTGTTTGSTSTTATSGGTMGNTNGTGGTTGGSSSTTTGQTGDPPPPAPRP